MKSLRALALLILFGSFAAPLGAEARQIDLNKAHFSTYFGGSFGNTRLGDSAYGASSGTGTTVDKKVPWTTSGDLGVAISFGRINFLMGGEILMPRSLSSISGKSASGADLFTLTSTVQGLIPMVNAEFVAYQTNSSRWLFGLGGGYVFASIENKYEMTAAGTSAFGVGDHVERGNGHGTLLQGYVGGEITLTDTAAIVVLGGYRNCIVESLQAPQDQKSLTGSQPSGSDLKNSDGGYRTLDLGGGFVGLQFRFYIGL